MIDNSITSVLWQIVCIVFYIFLIIFLATLIFNLISSTIQNYKKKKAANTAINELLQCMNKITNENETKKLDKNNDE